MVNRNLLRSLEDDDVLSQFEGFFPETDDLIDDGNWYPIEEADYDVNKIVTGKVLRVDEEFVLIDVGFKSEGSIPLNEWDDEPTKPVPGDILQVLIEDLEDETGIEDPQGMIRLSYKRALKIIEWERMLESVREGMVVTGLVTKKIKGGLLVDIGVSVFLPASQVDIRRPGDIGDYINRIVQCEVLKIDEGRRNIVVSRRSLIEKQREEDRVSLLQILEEGQIRKGVVKNIADFGAFVDLGGIDGLLHITDMTHDRIRHPSEMVNIDQEIEVMVLHIDREKQKIALGLKQMLPNPWDKIDTKYKVNDTVKGTVVNIMSYGAFVKLEKGIEGLVHISEMSWIRRINHPSELVEIGDEVDVMILNIDKEGQQLSLGMKQTQKNPWDKVIDRFPVGLTVTGKVRNLTNYGAFVELDEGVDGLLHVSDMSWIRKVSHPSEALEKGQEVTCKILAVDQERRRIALGLKQLEDDPWTTDIPARYRPGQVVQGKVTKITTFGVFVGLDEGLEGLLHISELSDDKIEDPNQLVKVGDDIEVKILRVDTEERKIGLSRRRLEWSEEDEKKAQAEEEVKASQKVELKGGLGGGGPLFGNQFSAKDEVAANKDEDAPAPE
ncbi:MAG TPA: 30S ribosomal protein S1 [Pirellulaceae bacterium]|nr:30S ribosomal protein S1 [Pirellulaceae bacterium]